MPGNQQIIHQYWATEMGMAPDFAPNAGGVICTAQQIYPGVQFFQREEFLVVAAPPPLVGFITDEVRGVPIRDIFSIPFVESLRIPGARTILGPARVGYADRSTLNPAPVVSGRLLTLADAAICQVLAAVLSPADIEQSGFHAGDAPAFGVFADNVLCAVASYRIWEPCLAHIIVATHPNYRRRGHGRMVVSGLAQLAFERNMILQYRALASNENSLKLARSLGFQRYCSTIYARLAM